MQEPEATTRGPAGSVRILPASDVADTAILGVIEEAFGSRRGAEWFRWKHRDGPWGPSQGYVAVDDEGALGVRLMLPWSFRQQERNILAWRAVEAATVARGRRCGIFGRLNKALMDEAAAAERWTAFFSTPNASSRPGYQKLGWTLLPSVPHRYWLVSRRRQRAATIVSEDVLTAFPSADAGGATLSTAWTEAAMRWRIDPRSGHPYQVARLRHADQPNGLLYRVLNRRGVNTVLIVYGWGKRRELSHLVAGVAGSERAPLVLAVRDGSVGSAIRGPHVTRGGSCIAVWDSASGPDNGTRPADFSRWRCDMADLESVL